MANVSISIFLLFRKSRREEGSDKARLELGRVLLKCSWQKLSFSPARFALLLAPGMECR